MNLYEINAAIQNFAFDVDEETGELLNADALDALNMAREEKLENIACWIKNLNADAKALRDEEVSLAARRKVVESKSASLARYLETALQGEKFETPRCRISYRRSKKVEVVDVANFMLWADNFAPGLVRTRKEPDRDAIKAAIQNGDYVDGARLVESISMTIK